MKYVCWHSLCRFVIYIVHFYIISILASLQNTRTCMRMTTDYCVLVKMLSINWCLFFKAFLLVARYVIIVTRSITTLSHRGVDLQGAPGNWVLAVIWVGGLRAYNNMQFMKAAFECWPKWGVLGPLNIRRDGCHWSQNSITDLGAANVGWSAWIDVDACCPESVGFVAAADSVCVWSPVEPLLFYWSTSSLIECSVFACHPVIIFNLYQVLYLLSKMRGWLTHGRW